MSRIPHIPAGFKDEIYSDPSPEDGPNFERLTRPLPYFSEITGQKHLIEKGFPTDFASFRLWDFELGGKTKKPAAWHDRLYADGKYRKWLCDLLFYEACRSEGMGRFRAGIRCAAVLFAPTAHRAWKAHRRGITPGAKFAKALTGGPDFTSTENHP